MAWKDLGLSMAMEQVWTMKRILWKILSTNYIFLFNGIRWPLFFYLHHNFQSYIIIFMHAPSGDWSTETEPFNLWSKRSTSKPPRLDLSANYERAWIQPFLKALTCNREILHKLGNLKRERNETKKQLFFAKSQKISW